MTTTSESAMVLEVASRLFTQWSAGDSARADRLAGWAPGLWHALSDAGFTTLSIPEDSGGSGGDLADACRVLAVCAAHAAPVPLAESALTAGWLLGRAKLPLPSGPLTVASTHDLTLASAGDAWELSGTARRVPWGRVAERLALLLTADDESRYVVCVEPALGTLREAANLAGEPRDTITFDHVALSREQVVTAPADVNDDTLRLRGALSRAALISGALRTLQTTTTRYAGERVQFGRPIATFQAVQAHLVRIAEHAACVDLATTVAYETAAEVGLTAAVFPIAAAKALAGEAAGAAAAAAHQAHGAIGMTQEHHLHTLTRRLWSWREEFGSERSWNEWIGTAVGDGGPDRLWPLVVTGRVEPYPSGWGR